MSFKDDVVAMKKAFDRQYAGRQAVLRVPPEKEEEMRMLSPEEIGDRADKLYDQGVRNTFPRFLGMRVEYDADNFEIVPE